MYIFSKNCVNSLSITSLNLEGISVFFFPFYNVNYRYEQLFKIFRSHQKQRDSKHRARTIENRAKMLKADWFKNNITHVLIKMVSPLGRVGILFFSSCYHSVYNCISYNICYYAITVKRSSVGLCKNVTRKWLFTLSVIKKSEEIIRLFDPTL